MDFQFLLRVGSELVGGIPLTVGLAAAALAVGFVIALLTALAAVSHNRVLRTVAGSYIYVFRSTPLLVQLFLIYFGLGQLEAVRESLFWSVLKSPMWCSIIALALNTGSYTGEIFRGAILSVPKGELEAATAGGMSRLTRLRRITFPVGIRIALPSYGNEIVMLVKATSLASTVTVLEVTAIAHRLIAETYRSIEVFAVAGAVYLVLNFTITMTLKWFEYRLNPHLR